MKKIYRIIAFPNLTKNKIQQNLFIQRFCEIFIFRNQTGNAICLIVLAIFTVNIQIANAQQNIVLTDANPDTTITTGSTATVYGTSGANHVTIENGANVKLVNFPGNNTITIKADSSLFTVSRSGATVTFQGLNNTVLKMPATKASQTLNFNGSSFQLLIRDGKVMLGNQKITSTPTTISGTVGSITLTVGSPSISADGTSSVAITAVVKDSSGMIVKPYTDVFFKTNLGKFKNGQQSYKETIIDNSGTVTVSLISPTTPGIAEVTCESSGITQLIQINFTHYDNSGLPVGEAFGLSLQYHNISGLWLSGLADNVYADLADGKGNAVQDGVPVSFRTYNTGGGFDKEFAVTSGMNENGTSIQRRGVATSTLYSMPNFTPAEGMVSVTAETDGGATTHITSIAVTPGYDSNIMYAGTNGGGVYKSTDSGRNWENISKSTLRVGQNWIEPYIKGNQQF